MERTRVLLKRAAFSCAVCGDLLKEPVTLPCGQSFCKSCVEASWATAAEGHIYQCPQCGQAFAPSPLPQKNIMLAELVEELQKAEDPRPPEEPASKRHRPPPPSRQPQETCSQHDEEMFCRSDRQLICWLCAVDRHKHHQMVSAAAERREREKEVDQSRGRIQQRVQDTEEEVRRLQQEEKNLSAAAEKAVKDGLATLEQLILDIKRGVSDMEQQIRSRQETEATRVRRLLVRLEQEISELMKQDAELQQLPHKDPGLVQNASPASSEEDAGRDLSLKLAGERATREAFLRYSRDIDLDPNTAHSRLKLSGRRVTFMGESQSPPDHPERFTSDAEVLSGQPLTGRCYWEVEWTGEVISVAVSYKTISRSGEDSRFGFNDKSWSLCCFDSQASFVHNSVMTIVFSVPSPRVGVYLDHSAGLLCFYSVSETMTLLHRVQTTFTQPLHAGVSVYETCEFLKLK